jgi:uncharacterized protein (DUF1015 family)
MPQVSPFVGLTFDPAVAGPLERVTAPPYDVISERRRSDLLAASPYSVVHLDLAEGPTDPAHPENRYARAARLLADWESRGALVRSPTSSYYVYEMSSLDATVRGLVCAMSLEPWGGSVVPHERTMTGPVEDRLHLLRSTATHLSAVYGTIVGPNAPLDELLDATALTPASLEATDEQGVIHRMWRVGPDPSIARWLAHEQLLIADGHHRYTTALRYRDERHAADGAGPWDRVLTFIVDAATQRLTVLPFHRIQESGRPPRDPGREVEDLAEALRARSDDDVVIATVTAGGAGARFGVLPLAGEAPAVTALHAGLLDGLVAAEALRFVPDAEIAADAVRNGGAVAAYLLPPTTPERIRAVIERGERLPQKSTYFWPKPRTGMIMMPLGTPHPRAGRAP